MPAGSFVGGAIEFLHGFDHVLWLGDLNYRVEFGAPSTQGEFERVLALVRGERWRHLLDGGDQLRREMRAGRVFHGFKEGPITFAPTYRMEQGAGMEGVYGNKRWQSPSYTDRVLYVKLSPGHRRCA